MKLLHPSDFSETAAKAHHLALDLSDRLEASLDAVFVQDHSDVPHMDHFALKSGEVNTELLAMLEKARQQESLNYQQSLSFLAARGGKATLLQGKPVSELLALIPAYDLVIMGAHGRNRLDNTFLGGVAGRLLRRSPVPILTVRDEAQTKVVQRVLLAMDFSKPAKHAWRWTQKLMQAGINVVLAHVIEAPGLQQDPEHCQKVTRSLESLTRQQQAERHILRGGDPLHTLPEIATECDADVIVIGLKRHPAIMGLVMGSLSDMLLRSSPVPVLGVPWQHTSVTDTIRLTPYL